jgi:hypothetical protein
VCGHCDAFATASWKQPPRVHRAVIEPPVAPESGPDPAAEAKPEPENVAALEVVAETEADKPARTA